MLRGVEKLADTVAVTMGPTGRNVILDKSYGGPTVTKDGVTVSKEIELEDRFENMGAKLVNEVASKTSDVAGDGTTTATVLARAIFREGLRNIAAGSNPTAVRRGIEKAVAAAVAHLATLAKPVTDKEEIAHVGAISANNDQFIGNLLAEAMEKVGKDGVITVEEGKTAETTYEVVEGMQFDKGYLSPYFINRAAEMDCLLEGGLHLDPREEDQQHPRPDSAVGEDQPYRQAALDHRRRRRGRRPGHAGGQQAPRHAPGLRGEGPGLRRPPQGDARRHRRPHRRHADQRGPGTEAGEPHPGAAGPRKKITVDRDSTTIVEGGGKQADVKSRIEQLKKQIEDSDSDYDREKLQERLAKLAGGVAVISVGANTETEMKQKKARVEDALHATRAAAEEGVLPGGGVALLRCREAVEKARGAARGDEKIGVDIILRCLTTPIQQIADNCGVDGSVVADEVRQKPANVGYDANLGKYVDMFKAGIIDPLKVVRTALENAASIAGLMLTTETLVTDLNKEDKKTRVEGSVR